MATLSMLVIVAYVFIVPPLHLQCSTFFDTGHHNLLADKMGTSIGG